MRAKVISKYFIPPKQAVSFTLLASCFSSDKGLHTWLAPYTIRPQDLSANANTNIMLYLESNIITV